MKVVPVKVIPMSETYNLEKWVWTEADFEYMGWHDSQIHAIAFSPDTFELLVDIDYILEWLQPTPQDQSFWLWVVPATLVFENVHNSEFNIDPSRGLRILDISRQESARPPNADYIGRFEEWL